jgi:hypothetical protein
MDIAVQTLDGKSDGGPCETEQSPVRGRRHFFKRQRDRRSIFHR